MRGFSIVLGCIAGILLTQMSQAELGVPTAQSVEIPKQAIENAKAWLSFVDDGNADKSWDQSSAYFQSRVSKDSWAATVKQVRENFGHVISRSFNKAELTNSLRDAPDSQYAILHFNIDASRHGAKETVTMMIYGGTWQVAGFYISEPSGLRHVPGVGALPMHWN